MFHLVVILLIVHLTQDFFVNHNWCCLKFGYIGTTYFDINRKWYLGLGSWLTILAIIIGIWGCLAFDTTSFIVQRSYWLGTRGSQTISGSTTYFSFYVGLRSVELVNCDFVPGWRSFPKNCIRQSIKFKDSACQTGPFKDFCDACDDNARSMWIDVATGLFGLLFSWQGCQQRMRSSADNAVQKLMGMISELTSWAPLVVGLVQFNFSCKQNLEKSLSNFGYQYESYSGPGLWCFALCAATGFIRMMFHILVPLPGMSCGKKNTDNELEKISNEEDSPVV